jgi:hypothetical protein
MKFSDINASRIRLIRTLRNLDDRGKRRVIIGVSAVSMVLVLGVWVRSLERLIPALAEDTGTSTATSAPRATSFIGTLSLGVQSIAGEFGARWQSTKDKIGPLFHSIEAQVNQGNTYTITPSSTSVSEETTTTPTTTAGIIATSTAGSGF